MAETQQQQTLKQLTALALSFATHVSQEEEMKIKIAGMYKILVTGDGMPPLPEIVRNHSEWIAERDAERCEEKMEKREDMRLDKKNTRDDRDEAIRFRRQLWLIFATQALGFILLGLAVALKWR